MNPGVQVSVVRRPCAGLLLDRARNTRLIT